MRVFMLCNAGPCVCFQLVRDACVHVIGVLCVASDMSHSVHGSVEETSQLPGLLQ